MGGDSLTVRSVADEAGEAGVDGRVSLCWAPLDVSDSVLAELTASLSAQERRRAGDLHRDRLRRRFIAAHGWLRHLLADQLDCAPQEVRIITGERGKPEVAGSDLCFSVARSAGIGLYATSWAGPVGVDLEAIRETVDIEGIAGRFFSSAERHALASVPEQDRLRAGFECWTCKEALVKATGTGITIGLDRVDVGVGPRHPPFSGWAIHEVDVAPGFAAAVAGAGLGASPPPVRQLGGVAA
jgi:4'-phosphopantetheinyl transferase